MANRDPNIDDIRKAIEEFPKVIKQKEEAHEAKEQVLKPFMKLAAELYLMEKAKASKPEFIKHYAEIQESDDSRYPGSDELLSIGSPFGRIFGLKRLGVHHELLKPGRRTSWPHAESTEEEFAYVIEGEPDVWLDGKLYRLKPGDGVGFVPGTGIAHTFLNNTESDVRLLVVGETTRSDNKVFYPLDDKRNQDIGDLLWKDAPKRDLGMHDGLPDKKSKVDGKIGPKIS